jgi:hypothetical protein
LHAPTTFLIFLIAQNKKCPQDQLTITNKPWENYYKAPEFMAKKLEWHG